MHRARLLAHTIGVDIQRYPIASTDYGAFRAFTSMSHDVILDVGANSGQFGRQCRQFGDIGPIVSFEPGEKAYLDLDQSASSDPLWQAYRLGLGEEASEMVLHVAANDGASSSLLPMLPLHEEAAPEAMYVHEERVTVQRLDAWYASNGSTWKRPAIKIDTQGFERQVLVGAGDLLREVVSLQLELSLVPLYDGAWLWSEAVSWLDDRDFRMAGLTPGFADPRTGQLLQFDGVFVKESSASR